MYLFLIILLGFLLRIINIDKPEGLWNDEYVSWFVASTPFLKGFWQEVLKQCHMPLYYLYLKPFTGFSDVVLRLTSVLPGVLSIPMMYLVGKEFDKKTGYFSAILTAVLPFLVYYSQEVRFYSLLFFFSVLNLYFLIKLLNNKKAWLGYALSSVLILFTHVLGGIYVGITLFIVLFKHKKISRQLLLSLLIALPLVLFLGVNIIKMLPSSQWWGSFSYTNIMFLFSDFFTPILTNNVNAPKVFFYNTSPLFVIFITLPLFIAMYYILKNAIRYKFYLFVVISTILIMSIFALSGNVIFITKYLIEILPILILLFALGVTSKIDNIVFVAYVLILLFSILTVYYPANLFRSEGHNLVCEVLNKVQPENVLFTYYSPDRFERYINIESKMNHISKINRFVNLEHPENVLSNIKKGETLSVVFLDSVSFVPESMINSSEVKRFPEMFVTFSTIRHKLIKYLEANYKDFSVYKNGSWTVVTGTRFK